MHLVSIWFWQPILIGFNVCGNLKFGIRECSFCRYGLHYTTVRWNFNLLHFFQPIQLINDITALKFQLVCCPVIGWKKCSTNSFTVFFHGLYRLWGFPSSTFTIFPFKDFRKSIHTTSFHCMYPVNICSTYVPALLIPINWKSLIVIPNK